MFNSYDCDFAAKLKYNNWKKTVVLPMLFGKKKDVRKKKRPFHVIVLQQTAKKLTSLYSVFTCSVIVRFFIVQCCS